MKNKAFTLAEVLVTLMIIGVIASITIPTLKKTSDEKAYVAGALKAYSELSAATKSLKRTEGPIPMWSLYATGEPVVDIMNKYKKIMPSVGVPPKSYTIQTLNNEATDFGNNFSNSKATITAADGSIYSLLGVNANCPVAYKGTACFMMLVDVNGSKDPNMIGVDVFAFNILRNGDVVPVKGKCPPDKSTDSTDDSDSNDDSDSTGLLTFDQTYGMGCTARVITEKDISW